MKIKIASYPFSSEAYIAKAKLESEGIEVFLWNENVVNTDPGLTNAIGGVQIFVFQDDVIKAKNILGKISEYSLDDQNNHLNCPNCNEQKVLHISNVKPIVSLIGLFFANLFRKNLKYHCENCKYEF